MVFAVAPLGCAVETAAGGKTADLASGDYPVPGGTYYQASCPDAAVSHLMRLLDFFDQKSGRDGKTVSQSCVATAYVRLAVLLSGIDRIQGYEASSRLAGDEGWFCNTRLWKCSEKIPLSQLTGEEEPFTAEDMGDLPANTVFAARVQWEPGLLLEMLKLAPVHEKAAGSAIRGLTGMEPVAFGKSLTGCWEVIVVADSGDVVVRVAVPDADGKFYQLLSAIREGMERSDADRSELFREGTRTFYCSDRDRKALFAPPEGRRLENTELFQSARKALPRQRGAALCWVNLAPAFLTGAFPPVPDDRPGRISYQGLSLLRRVPEGMICWTASTQDLNCVELNVLAPVLKVGFFDVLEQDDAEDAPQAAEANAPAPAPELAAASDPAVTKQNLPAGLSQTEAELLSAAFVVLRAEAENHGGAFPQEKDVTGLLGEMLPQFCYIEGWTLRDNGKLPLLIRRPDAGKKDSFSVLCVDGTSCLIQLEDYRSLKRAAGELHSRYSYPEQDFIRLIRKAVLADQAVENAPQNVEKRAK